MKPLVSVVIPVYNIEEYVGKCLESVCGQSYDAIEIIVVDDGSIDGSGEICDRFAKRDRRIKVYHKKNNGLSAARNFGITKTHGEYVVLVDGDDYVRNSYIGDMVDVLDFDTDIVICGYNVVVPKEETITGKEATVRLLIKQENLDIVAWNKLYRRNLFDGIEYPKGEKHEDSLTTYKLLAKARSVKYVSKSLYVYVTREGSIMNTAKEVERLKTRERAAMEAVGYFAKDKDLEQAAEVAVLLAKYAFMDAAIRKLIEKKYFEDNFNWIKEHRDDFKNNKYMTKKLKYYNMLNRAKMYKTFRTIV